MKKLIIISHKEDLDGIGSAAILKRYFEQVNNYFNYYYFSLYNNFIDLLTKAIIKNFDIFYISDIGFNKSYLPFLEGTHNFYSDHDYSIIKSKIKRIIWIDHHLINQEDKVIMKSVLKDFIHETNNICAARLVYNHLKNEFGWDDKIAEEICIYANAVDYNMITEVSDTIQRVINANQNNLGNLFKIVNYLSKGDFKNEWIQEQNKERLKIEKIELDRVLNNLIKLRISDLKIIIAYSEIFTTGYLIKYLYNNLDADIYLTINKNQVSIRSHTINVREIAMEFNGGGHEFRAGFYYKDIIKNNKLNQEFIEYFKKVIKKSDS
ncbi:MAG: DHH family phosphoesterase [Candidatus Helarchaeota archaeon]